MILVGKKAWSKEYHKGKYKNIWIVLKIDGEEFFLEEFEDYLSLKERLKSQNSLIEYIGLQYKSHLVYQKSEDADGVYLIKSVKGHMSGESIDTYTTGVVKGNKVKKKMWSIPALVPEGEYEDNIDECFEEAIILNEKRKTKVIQ